MTISLSEDQLPHGFQTALLSGRPLLMSANELVGTIFRKTALGKPLLDGQSYSPSLSSRELIKKPRVTIKAEQIAKKNRHRENREGLEARNESSNQDPRKTRPGYTNGASGLKRPGETLEPPGSKRGKAPPSIEMLQCGSYALEMLSHGGLRKHVLGALITDTAIELLYYDHSPPIKTRSVSFKEDPSKFIAFLYCMHHATLNQWGFIDAISPPTIGATSDIDDEPFRNGCLRLKSGEILTLGNLLAFQHAMIGRGTCVVDVTHASNVPPEWNDNELVVKFSFSPTKNRKKESEILKEIKAHAEMGEDKLHGWVLNSLPEILHSETIEDKDLQDKLSALFGNKYERRNLEILIMTKLFPLTELHTTSELAPRFLQIVKCYRWVHDIAGYIHRDISLNNLMYRKKGGALYGVLNDWDFAVPISATQGNGSTQRTGTLPYMSIDFSQDPPPRHIYRHDLESFFYVLTVLTSGYHKGERVRNATIQEWFQPGDRMYKDKELYLCKPGVAQVVRPTEGFLQMFAWTLSIKNIFLNGYNARLLGPKLVTVSATAITLSASPFVEETLGGHVTFDKFLAACSSDFAVQ